MRRVAHLCIILLASLLWTAPVMAACVGANGQSRSGTIEKYAIAPDKTDHDRFVRLTKGPATVQLDVQQARDSRGGTCSAANEKLSFSLHWTKRGDASACLSPSVRGPASFLSCYFRVDKLGPGGRPGVWYVRVKNAGRCTVDYHLICRDGKHTP